MTNPHAEENRRLGEAVRARREELDLTQREVAEAGGFGVSTIRQIEVGAQPGGVRRSTFASLDEALMWTSGSAAEVWGGGGDGGAPTPKERDASKRWPEARRRGTTWAEFVRANTPKDIPIDQHTLTVVDDLIIARGGEPVVDEPGALTAAQRDALLRTYSSQELLRELERRLV